MFNETGLLIISFVLMITVMFYVYEKETNKPKTKVIKQYYHINF